MTIERTPADVQRFHEDMERINPAPAHVTISDERFNRLVQDRHDLKVTLIAALCALEELHREAQEPNGTVQLAGRYMPIIRTGRKHLDRMREG